MMIRVVRGNPTPEELTAAVAVVAGMAIATADATTILATGATVRPRRPKTSVTVGPYLSNNSPPVCVLAS